MPRFELSGRRTSSLRHFFHRFQADLPLHLLQLRFSQRDDSAVPTEGSLHLVEYPGTGTALQALQVANYMRILHTSGFTGNRVPQPIRGFFPL